MPIWSADLKDMKGSFCAMMSAFLPGWRVTLLKSFALPTWSSIVSEDCVCDGICIDAGCGIYVFCCG